MPDETHKLQKDPPEGSRKVIERELQRQEHKPQHHGEETGANKQQQGETTAKR